MIIPSKVMLLKIFTYVAFIELVCCIHLSAQPKTENVVLITIDGLRWQELFMGPDQEIMKNKRFMDNVTGMEHLLWNNDAKVRRAMLFPFMWSTVASQGQIYGNRNLGSKVNLSNRYWFSYPGYNELLTGRSDKRIRNNARKVNPNQTILEFANQQNDFKDRVAAFASWDVFHYIIDSKRSGILVNAGTDTARIRLTAREKYLNHLQQNTPSPWKATRFDEFTHNYAKEYFRKNSPRLLLIAYGETDEFAHMGRYDAYLQAAHKVDNYIREIWELIQSDTNYKNKTTIIITTDHGRGNGTRSWRNHGIRRTGSNHTWFAIIGPDTPALGEVKIKGHYYTNQIANTIATLLNLNYLDKDADASTILTNLAD